MLEQERWRRLNGELGGDIDAMPPRLLTIPWDHVRAQQPPAGLATQSGGQNLLSACYGQALVAPAGTWVPGTIVMEFPRVNNATGLLTVIGDTGFAPGLYELEIDANSNVALAAGSFLEIGPCTLKSAGFSVFNAAMQAGRFPDVPGQVTYGGTVDIAGANLSIAHHRYMRFFAPLPWLVLGGIRGTTWPTGARLDITTQVRCLAAFDQVP